MNDIMNESFASDTMSGVSAWNGATPDERMDAIQNVMSSQEGIPYADVGMETLPLDQLAEQIVESSCDFDGVELASPADEAANDAGKMSESSEEHNQYDITGQISFGCLGICGSRCLSKEEPTRHWQVIINP